MAKDFFMGQPLRVRIGFLHRRRELRFELPPGSLLRETDGRQSAISGSVVLTLLEEQPATGTRLLKLVESPRKDWLEHLAATLETEGLTCKVLPFAPGFESEDIRVQPTFLLAAVTPGPGQNVRAQVGDLLHRLADHGTHGSHGTTPPQAGDLAHLNEDAWLFQADHRASALVRLESPVDPPRECNPDGLCFILPPATHAAVDQVEVGIDFHWQHRRTLNYPDTLRVFVDHMGLLGLANDLPLEDYLRSVNSSEMTADCPLELLKAQTIAARSTWLATRGRHHHGEAFDICADDHCQCYRGVDTIADTSRRAVDETEGQVLCHHGSVCDARYSKSCGGIVEAYENVWEDTPVPYMVALCDNDGAADPPRRSEAEWQQYILEEEDVWCNTERWQVPGMLGYSDGFYRWTVEMTRTQVADLLRRRAGLEFGELHDITPGPRGRSGRLLSMDVHTDRGVFTIGKELKIRRALSESHLYSAAIRFEWRGETLVIHGKGWGHGVGMCQLGAARMALAGRTCATILTHYYPGSELRRLH